MKETLQLILLSIIGLYIVGETVAGIILYRKRHIYGPRLRQMIGQFIGTSDLGIKLKRVENKLNSVLDAERSSNENI